MIKLLPPLSPDERRCSHERKAIDLAVSENLGGGPRVRCVIETCLDCARSWITEKRRCR